MLESPLAAVAAASAAACLLVLALVPAFRRVAVRVGLVDRPDGRRKLQVRPIPKAGGPAVLCAILATLALVAGLKPGLAAFLANDARFWSLLGAATVIGLVGLADDFWELRGRHKIVGQLFA